VNRAKIPVGKTLISGMIADLKANSTTTAKVNEQGRTMAEQDSAPGVDLYHVAHVVSSYVRHHRVAADQLTGLIVGVHRTLAGLGRVPPRAGAAPTSGADPTLGPAGLHRLSRVRVSRADASPASARRARPRYRRLPHPLEPTGGLSSHRTGVFDTTLDDGQGDAFWAPSHH
jgi:hypothetical protein